MQLVQGERIERNLDALQVTLIRAKFTRQRQWFAKDANLSLGMLRFPMLPQTE